MFPKLSPGFVKNDTWISLWRENNIYIVQNWRLEAYIGKRSTLCLQNTFDAPCQRRLKASCCIKRIKSLNYYGTGLHKLWHPCILAARKWRENEEMKRNRRENEEMKRGWGNGKIHSPHFLFFPPYLCISNVQNCQILSQNVKYGTFVANVTKDWTTYTLWENNPGSNSLWESSAICARLLGKR